MPMPSEYSYLYDTCDFVWNNTNINTFESGKQIKLTNSGMTPLDITNVTFLAGVDHGGETPFDRATLCPSRMISAYITDNGGTVTVNYSGKQAFWTPYPGDPGICYHFSAYGTSGDYLSCQSPDWYPRTYFNRTTSFSNLSDCCKYIWRNFAHLYIYYNNELWVDPFNPGPIITYNWQSVPSISGKNGILQSLVQIKEEAINDGEPVSEATVLSFDSLGNINIPSVIDEQMPVDPSDVTSVTATYLIPALEDGTYAGIKLLVKKGSIPTSEEDADKVVNLDEPTSILRIDSKSVGNLDEDSHYYFVVKLVDEVGTEATSDPKDIWTSHSEGWSFDYTGEIQTFVAPKTGIYSLETWGAQGGDASDGTLTARGGYGAYAYGEVLLQQGDTLYINVGGQNGYGGGGNPTNIIPIEASVLSNAYKSSYSNSTTPENVDTDYYDSFSDVAQYFGTDTCITTGELSKQQLSNDNGSIKFTQPNPYDIMSYTVIPLGGTYNVTNISFTYSKTINTGQIYVGANYNRLCIAIVKIVNAKIQSISWVFDERENENKSNVSIDESINAEGNYILIHEAAGTVLINDLVLTVR